MRHRIPRTSLAPDGFSVDEVKIVADRVQIQLRSRHSLGRCPDCGRPSRRVQSRYVRRPADLPLSGRRVQLKIVVRRFWCDAILCGRRIFCEQFVGSVLARYGRRTQRLETIVHHLGLSPVAGSAAGYFSQWAQRRRLAEKANQSGLARTPSARIIARLMTAARDDLAKSEAVLVAAIEMSVPELVAARDAICDFQSMIRSKTERGLDDWLEKAKNSLVGSFANGVEKDIDAVRNAIVSPWSNGQTEGQITRLKLIKRQMYGRAKLDLLQARLIGAP